MILKFLSLTSLASIEGSAHQDVDNSSDPTRVSCQRHNLPIIKRAIWRISEHCKYDKHFPVSIPLLFSPMSLLITLNYGIGLLTSCHHSSHRLIDNPYMLPLTAEAHVTAYVSHGIPDTTFSDVHIQYYDLPAKVRTTFPIIIFTPGLAILALHLHSQIANEIASKSYLVISVDHLYDARIVEFSDGSYISSIFLNTDEAVPIELPLEYYPL